MKNEMYVCGCALLLVLALASTALLAQSSPNTLSGEKTSKFNACSLLASAEIKAVQGEEVKEAVPSSQANNGILISQCIFHTSASAKSVILNVATPAPVDSTSNVTPRKYWDEQFHSLRQEHDKEAKRGESEEEAPKPQLVEGVGDEAYWAGNSMMGALYVLRDDKFLRISVGGVRDLSARKNKSIELARAVLKHLQTRDSEASDQRSKEIQRQ